MGGGLAIVATVQGAGRELCAVRLGGKRGGVVVEELGEVEVFVSGGVGVAGRQPPAVVRGG